MATPIHLRVWSARTLGSRIRIPLHEFYVVMFQVDKIIRCFKNFILNQDRQKDSIRENIRNNLSLFIEILFYFKHANFIRREVSALLSMQYFEFYVT
jgi:hypothetical protein